MAIINNVWEKDPDAILDYSIQWSSWLSTGDSIVSSVWSISASIPMRENSLADINPIVIDNSFLTDSLSTVWVSAGTVGFKYLLTNRVTTNDGRTDDRHIVLQVIER